MGAVLASECPPWTAGRSLSSAGTPTASKTRCRLAGRSDLPLQSCAGRGATSGPSRHQHLHRCLCGRLQVAPWSPATFVRPWSVELGRRAFAVLHERAFLPEETQIHLGIVTLSPPCDGTLPPRRGAWPSPAAAPAPAPGGFQDTPLPRTAAPPLGPSPSGSLLSSSPESLWTVYNDPIFPSLWAYRTWLRVSHSGGGCVRGSSLSSSSARALHTPRACALAPRSRPRPLRHGDSARGVCADGWAHRIINKSASNT